MASVNASGVVTAGLVSTLIPPKVASITATAAGQSIAATVLVKPPLGTYQRFDSQVRVQGQPPAIQGGANGTVWYSEYPATLVRIEIATGTFTRFQEGLSGTPTRMCLGPDGNLWFCERQENKVGRVTPSGVVTEFSIPTSDSQPIDICVGPDGALWFTESGAAKLGRITTSGTLREMPTNPDPTGIAAGPDGNLWVTHGFPSSNSVSHVAPDGSNQVTLPFPIANSGPGYICLGPDGNMWVTELQRIARVTPTGNITEFSWTSGRFIYPSDITVGADGNLWIADFEGRMVRMTPQGVFSDFAVYPAGEEPPAWITRVAAGPDGNIWFTMGGAISSVGVTGL
ncbi:MAG: hypothetical protein KF760_27150 [Candidatus Eremiobacteraeota bacterium]|nr:hypothetical protein [Candidatus Eremiobacteraeota bacterium]